MGQGGSEWMILDTADSEGENLEKVAANRKRPLGRKDVKRQGSWKKKGK